MRIIKALDLGTTGGFASYCAANNEYKHSRINFSKAPNLLSNQLRENKEAMKSKVIKYIAFENFLNVYLKDADVVCYEKVRRHVSCDSSHAYGAFEAILQVACIRLNIELVECEVSSIKKHIAGKGNANKELMIKAVQDRGFDVTQDDEADAIAILLYFMETKNG